MADPRTRLRILRWTLDAVLIGIIVLALLGVVLGRIIPMTGRETLIIGGASMEPQIQLGAAVVVEPVTPDQLRVGDIVSLRSGPGLRSIFTHRITRLVPRPDGLWIETKGDNNRIVDPSITPASDVMGRVMLNVPYAGYLLMLMSIPSGVALIVCLAGIVVTLIWIVETAEIEGAARRGRARGGIPKPDHAGLAPAAASAAPTGVGLESGR